MSDRKPWSDLKARMSPESQVRVTERANELLAAMPMLYHTCGKQTAPTTSAIPLDPTPNLPCPACAQGAPISPEAPVRGLDFEKAEQEADAGGHGREYRMWGDRFRAELERQHTEAIRQAVAKEQEALEGGFAVESVEWAHPANDIPEGCTRIIVRGTIKPVGAGDTVTYRAALKEAP